MLPQSRQVDKLEVHHFGAILFGHIQHFFWCHALRPPQQLPRQIASSPRSPVRMRTASSIGSITIFPSPIRPVFAEETIVSTTVSAMWSGVTISILIFGKKSTTYSAPR